MKKYRVMKRSTGYNVEELVDGYSWKQCNGPFGRKDHADGKMKRLREKARHEERNTIGQQIIASWPFCAGVRVA